MKIGKGTVVISHGTLVDGTGRAAVPDGVVQIRDGQITYAGAASSAPA